MIKIEMHGFDQLEKSLHELKRKANLLDGEHHLPINEVMTDKFVSKHTEFPSFFAMAAGGNFKVSTREEFAAIPDDKWDEFIRSVSEFDTWQSMLAAASKEWALTNLGL